LTLGERDGEATVVALDDFAAASNAVEELARDGVAGTFDGFDPLAFRPCAPHARALRPARRKAGRMVLRRRCGDAASARARAGIPDLPAGETFRVANRRLTRCVSSLLR
jgi:hypothetical protein